MYEPKTTPYAHQRDAWSASWDKKFWALFCEMGTGKTKITIDTWARFTRRAASTPL